MPIFYKDNGVWKTVSDVYTKVAGVWQQVPSAFYKVSGAWQKFYQLGYIPSGAIAWSYDGNIPTGWANFGFPAGKICRAWAGSGGTIGDEGGDYNGSFTSNNPGDHTGTTFNVPYNTLYETNANYSRANLSGGAHQHTLTLASVRPERMQAIFIQAGSDQPSLPANAFCLAANALASMTEITDQGHLAGGSSSLNHVAAVTDGTGSSTSQGAHNHQQDGFPVSLAQTGYLKKTTDQGAHTHSWTQGSCTWDQKKAYVRAFYHASLAITPKTGMIFGWESDTPPPGYGMCDGTNGTIDLRDHMININSTKTPGAKDGSYSLNGSYATNYSGSHNHRNTSVSNLAVHATHHSNNVTHRHTGTYSKALAFAWYRLAFIQYLGA